ncbi:MAG: GAF domain-containing protein [Chloroflexi bacterium]|nr:GAF domain-containing protein [Chloroflexota bacterium]
MMQPCAVDREPLAWAARLTLAVGLAGLACAVGCTLAWEAPLAWPPILFFAALNAVAARADRGQRVRPSHVIALTSFLVCGLPSALWAALLGALLSAASRRWLLSGQEASPPALGAVQGGSQALALWAGGSAFLALGGGVPALGLDAGNALPLALLFTLYFATNLALSLACRASLGQPGLRAAQLLPALQAELLPLPFSLLLASVYNQGNLGNSVLLTAAMLLLAVVLHRWDQQQRLQGQMAKLSTLNDIAQETGGALALEPLLEAICRQTRRALEVENLYVALGSPDGGTLSFPFVCENGQRVHWPDRPFAAGPAEYVIQTGRPLLLPWDAQSAGPSPAMPARLSRARSWLGVPLLADNQSLGLMVVQDFARPNAFDEGDLKLLTAIAAQAAAALRYQQTSRQLGGRVRQLQTVLDSTEEGILLVDPQGVIEMANRALQACWGLSAEALLQRNLFTEAELAAKAGLPTGAAATDLEALEHNATGGRALVRIGRRILERVVTSVEDSHGHKAGWLLTFHEVTEERRLDELREDLSQMMVHDMHSPLASIATALKMLQELGEELSPDQREQLMEVALRALARLDDMIHTLLEIGRLQSGELCPETSPTCMYRLTQAVLRGLSPVMAKANLRAATDFPQDLPEAQVDRALMERVLSNLVDNAIKFSPDGEQISVTARLVSDAQASGRWLRLAVRDRGPGVPAAYREVIFEKFGQVRGARARRRGAGLGLTFCRLAVQAHGGQIGLDCPPEGGSEFWFTVPAAPAAKA